MPFQKYGFGVMANDYVTDYNKGYRAPYTGVPTCNPGMYGEIGHAEYLNQEVRVECKRFYIEQRKRVMKTMTDEICLRQDQALIDKWETEIERLSTPEVQRAEALRLLEHRSKYFSLLTPEDQEMVGADNAVLITYLTEEDKEKAEDYGRIAKRPDPQMRGRRKSKAHRAP